MKVNSSIFLSITLIALCLPAFVRGQEMLSGNVSLEFKRIIFPERRPNKYESYVDLNVILDREQRGILWDLLQALKNNPTIGVKVIGFADKHECHATECEELSLRRATLVFDWLHINGIPGLQLQGPIGESTGFPLDDGETREGVALNRRVQLEPYSVLEKEFKKK